MISEIKKEKKDRRHRRIKAKVLGRADKPRLCVFRSVKHIYGELIDDEKRKTLVAASDFKLKKIKTENGKTDKVAIAYEVGKLIAEKAIKGKIESVVFDRGGYRYHGRVKALAEGARKGGLKF